MHFVRGFIVAWIGKCIDSRHHESCEFSKEYYVGDGRAKWIDAYASECTPKDELPNQRGSLAHDIPYKMKYWRGVNFGDWQFLDKIANMSSTNNNYIIESMCHFLRVTLQLENYVALLQYLKRNDIPKVSLYQSWICYHSTSFSKQNSHIQKSVGDDIRFHPGVSHWNNDSCPLQ